MSSLCIPFQLGSDRLPFSVPLIEDSDFFLESLDPDLFPGISDDVKVHNGFKDAQARSAQDVLAAVQQTLDDNGSSNVAVVGHSLGAAIALIDTMFLSMNLDSSVNVRHIGYGLPRVRFLTEVTYCWIADNRSNRPVTRLSRTL